MGQSEPLNRPTVKQNGMDTGMINLEDGSSSKVCCDCQQRFPLYDPAVQFRCPPCQAKWRASATPEEVKARQMASSYRRETSKPRSMSV